MFGLEDPVGVVERFGTARDRQWLELRQWHSFLFYNWGGGEAIHGEKRDQAGPVGLRGLATLSI